MGQDGDKTNPTVAQWFVAAAGCWFQWIALHSTLLVAWVWTDGFSRLMEPEGVMERYKLSLTWTLHARNYDLHSGLTVEIPVVIFTFPVACLAAGLLCVPGIVRRSLATLSNWMTWLAWCALVALWYYLIHVWALLVNEGGNIWALFGLGVLPPLALAPLSVVAEAVANRRRLKRLLENERPSVADIVRHFEG